MEFMECLIVSLFFLDISHLSQEFWFLIVNTTNILLYYYCPWEYKKVYKF